MAELKTRPTAVAVDTFLSTVGDEKRREECRSVIEMMREATGEEPVMWGGSIVGFGKYHYKYDSGREGEWMVIGFSPRKNDLTLYLLPGIDAFPELKSKLGKFRTGKSCLYLKRLSDVNLDVLRQLIRESVGRMEQHRIRE